MLLENPPVVYPHLCPMVLHSHYFFFLQYWIQILLFVCRFLLTKTNLKPKVMVDHLQRKFLVSGTLYCNLIKQRGNKYNFVSRLKPI